MSEKKNKTYTVLLIPEDKGRTISLRINKAIFRSVIAFVILCFIGILSLVIFSGRIAVRLQLVNTLEEENRQLVEQNQKMNLMSEKIQKIQELNEYIRYLALEKDVEPEPIPVVRTDNITPFFENDASDDAIDTIRLFTDSVHIEYQASETPDQFLTSIPYIRPVEGWITKKFALDSVSDSTTSGQGMYKHPGVDFAAAQGSLIRATAPGIVREVKYDHYLGKIITIQHQYDFVTRYGHCSQILVSPGNHVTRGQTIALVGNTGFSSAPHLHYEVLKNGHHVDPLRYILDYKQ